MNDAIRVADALGDRMAPSRPVSGRIDANSSPPNRATTSVSRAQPRMTAAASTSALLPARWPCWSLTFLKPSRSRNSSDSGRPLRTARLVFPAQHLVEVARVLEPGEVVGDRQRLGLLQRQGVVERNGGRLEQHRATPTSDAPSAGAADDGLGSRPTSAPTRAIPANQRKGHDDPAAGPAARVLGEVAREELQP